MESDEIPLKVVHRIFNVFLGYTGVDHEASRGRWSQWVILEQVTKVGILERVKREVPPDVIGVWIRPEDVFEPASVDLIIVSGVAPTTNAGGRVVKEGRVVHVTGICVKDW